jgi:hypothetical protein
MGSQICQLVTKRLYKPKKMPNEQQANCKRWSKQKIMAQSSCGSHTNMKIWLIHQDISQS